MTRKYIGFLFVIVLIVLIGVQESHSNGSPQWVTGKVVSIVENQDAGLISLELPDGELVSITSAHDVLKGINIGDIVTLQIVEGRVQLIQVAESKTTEKPAPERKDKGVQWVQGEVVSIQQGETDSMISIQMSGGTVFNVAASNDKIEGIKVGDHVIAKVYQGWAESITKK